MHASRLKFTVQQIAGNKRFLSSPPTLLGPALKELTDLCSPKKPSSLLGDACASEQNTFTVLVPARFPDSNIQIVPKFLKQTSACSSNHVDKKISY